MQALSGKIENGIESIVSASLYLSNKSVKEIQMTEKIIPSSPKSIKICTVKSCPKPFIARNLCSSHYRRLVKYGNPLGAPCNWGVGDTPEKRFWSRVNKKSTVTGCWIWQGYLMNKGYGSLSFKGKIWRAHRLSYYLTHNIIPTLYVLHSCDNPKCVNPSHLREGTQKENIQEMYQKGRRLKR